MQAAPITFGASIRQGTTTFSSIRFPFFLANKSAVNRMSAVEFSQFALPERVTLLGMMAGKTPFHIFNHEDLPAGIAAETLCHQEISADYAREILTHPSMDFDRAAKIIAQMTSPRTIKIFSKAPCEWSESVLTSNNMPTKLEIEILSNLDVSVGESILNRIFAENSHDALKLIQAIKSAELEQPAT